MGYSPWPCKILEFNKSRTTATVQYYGYELYTGKIKIEELVQLDEISKDAIGNLVSFILQAKCIKDFDRFAKAIKEVQMSMKFSQHT